MQDEILFAIKISSLVYLLVKIFNLRLLKNLRTLQTCFTYDKSFQELIYCYPNTLCAKKEINKRKLYSRSYTKKKKAN